MNFSQLQYVKAVAELGSFSKAAERCCVTQPTLSNAVAQIESEFGGQIFFRTTRKIGVTPFGEQLLPLIEAVLDAQDELLKTAKARLNPSHKLIRIGLSPLINTHLLLTALEPFRQAHPEVDMVLKECYLDDLQQRLETHKVDVMIAPKGRKSRSQASQIFYEEGLCYLPNAAKADSRPPAIPIRLREVAGEIFVLPSGVCGLTEAVRELFKDSGLKLREYSGQALNHKVLEDWAALGIGAAILPRSKISAGNQTACPLLLDKANPAKLEYAITWNKNAPQAEHLKAFLRYFKETVPKLIKGLAT